MLIHLIQLTVFPNWLADTFQRTAIGGYSVGSKLKKSIFLGAGEFKNCCVLKL